MLEHNQYVELDDLVAQLNQRAGAVKASARCPFKAQDGNLRVSAIGEGLQTVEPDERSRGRGRGKMLHHFVSRTVSSSLV